jgi:hypothetical protein
LPRRGARRRCSPGRYRASFSKVKGPEQRGEDGERITGPNAATGSPARRTRHSRRWRAHLSSEIGRYRAPFFKQSPQGECGGDRDPVFVTSAAGEKPEGRPPWMTARSSSELADTALEATNQGIGGEGRGRGARGISPRLQTGRGRLGAKTDEVAERAPVARRCGTSRARKNGGLKRECSRGRGVTPKNSKL